MLCITALLFGLFGWKKRNCASRTSTAPSIPDQASNPYSGLSPFEVAALFRRLAEAQAQRQVRHVRPPSCALLAFLPR